MNCYTGWHLFFNKNVTVVFFKNKSSQRLERPSIFTLSEMDFRKKEVMVIPSLESSLGVIFYCYIV